MGSKNQLSSKKTISNILKVALSNSVSLISGLLVSFLLPNALGVSDFGYYKIFTLYAGYTGLFHFGIIDGILLKYGGMDYDQLDRSRFRKYSWTLFSIEIVISALVVFFSVILLDGEMRFIFICLAFYLVCFNLITYYQYISQITNRFGELSKRSIIQSVLTCVVVFSIWVASYIYGVQMSYRKYVLAACGIQAFLCVWYLITYQDITFGTTKYESIFEEIITIIKLGMPLLVANLSQSLLLNIDRQFVSVLFDTETYAIYAFAYNMMTLIATAVSAIAIVLYPTLKRLSVEELNSKYHTLISSVLVLVFAMGVLFYLFSWFVGRLMPKYYGAIQIVRIIFPGIAISSAVTIIMQNYYKVLGKNLLYFTNCLLIIILSCIANMIAYRLWGTTSAISMVSVAVMSVWYFLSEWGLIRKIKKTSIINAVYLILMSIAFYVITAIQNQVIGVITYIATFSFSTWLLYRKEMHRIFTE